MPRSSIVGVSVAVAVMAPVSYEGWEGRPEAPLHGPSVLLAVLLVRAGADVRALEVPVLDRLVPVHLGDRDRLREGGRHEPLAVAHLRGDTDRLPALDQRDRQVGCSSRLNRNRLVDGDALPPGDDVLDALHRRVLTGDRDRLEMPRLERRDHRVAKAVVGRVHRVDLVARAGEHLLEDRERLLVVPAGNPLIRTLLEHTALVKRAEDRVVALLEERGVVVRRRAVQLGDDRVRRVDALCLRALDEALALELADLDVVEGHVVRRRPAKGEAVVVDDLHAVSDRVLLDRRAGAGVEVDEQDDLRTVRDGLLRLRLLRGSLALGIDDAVRQPGLLEGLREERPVSRLPASGRLGVGKTPRALTRGFFFGCVAGGGGEESRHTCGQRHRDDDCHRLPAGDVFHYSSFSLWIRPCYARAGTLARGFVEVDGSGPMGTRPRERRCVVSPTTSASAPRSSARSPSSPRMTCTACAAGGTAKRSIDSRMPARSGASAAARSPPTMTAAGLRWLQRSASARPTARPASWTTRDAAKSPSRTSSISSETVMSPPRAPASAETRAVDEATVSRQPRLPQRHSTPSDCTETWPISPAKPAAPEWSRPAPRRGRRPGPPPQSRPSRPRRRAPPPPSHRSRRGRRPSLRPPPRPCLPARAPSRRMSRPLPAPARTRTTARATRPLRDT